MMIEEEEEFEGLVSSIPASSSSFSSSSSSSSSLPTRRHRKKRNVSWQERYRFQIGLAALLVTATMVVFAYLETVFTGDEAPSLWNYSTYNTNNTQLNTSHPYNGGMMIDYDCPVRVAADKNDFDGGKEYLEEGAQPFFNNKTYFLDHFRNHSFDGWGRTYDEFKASMREFKTKYFVPNLQNGDSIYESACGIGLNLYLTLEILQEEGGISDVTVYGNEYLQESVDKANMFLETLLDAQETNGHPKNKKGRLCHGDSTNLSHVPANSFDLVFTGYISPLWDPLEFGGTEDNYYGKMTKICRDPQKNENLWEYQKLAEIMQEEQEDWYSIWTTEMIRIAKPGKAIIIEEISLPYCDNMEDWGGVRRDFWKEGTERYGWDIDPESLMVIEGTQKMRYNVLMKKTI